MSAQLDYLHEVEQDPFDPAGFVQRLAWRSAGCPASRSVIGDDFDSIALYNTFEQAIRDLSTLYETTLTKSERLEVMCKEEQTKVIQQVHELQRRNKSSLSNFQELDERINFVATKVVHLGDQLESINVPRTRAVEAQKLMNYFAEFLNPGPLISEVFTDRSQLNQAADVIQKLNLVAQELPAEKFDSVKCRIAEKYDEIEQLLVGKFALAHRSDDRGQMKEIAGILSHFKHYSQCIDAFIEESQLAMYGWENIFNNVMPLCSQNYPIMKEVFINPDQVLVKFILTIYHGKLLEHIQLKLENKKQIPEEYLETLFNLYCETVKLSNELSIFNVGNDPTFLHKVTKNIFLCF